jgi:ribonuclease HII
MAILTGIDEAGYGPILGPLVVSSTTFTVPDELLKEDMWKLLKVAVGKTKRALAGRILIADSKKAFNRKTGCGHLRRAVISAIRCLDKSYEIPANAKELAEILCPDSLGRLADYPWYKELEGVELGGENSDFNIAAGVFSRNLASNDMRLVDICSQCLDVGYYNKMVSDVRNKASVLFTSVAKLIHRAYEMGADGEQIQVLVDRQGGRISYVGLLRKMFPQLELCVVRQDEKCSSYELVGAKTLRVHFAIKADSRFLPVSLASMASKYVREVMMESINRYFLGFCPEIKPTAGYWQDGLRFIEDVESKLGHLEYDPEKLIRSR